MGEIKPVTKDYQKHRTMFYRAFERFFGAKGRKLDEAILSGYWNALGNYEIDLLVKALDDLALEDNAFLPDAGAIITKINNIRSSDKTSPIPAYCLTCDSTGMVLVTKMHNGVPYPHVYRCECLNGQRIDRRILSITSVGGIHLEPDDVPEKKLPITTLKGLESTPGSHVWEEGVEVTKICADCGKPYSVRHERRVDAAELQRTHLDRTRPHVCELCFIDEGRRRGQWV